MVPFFILLFLTFGVHNAPFPALNYFSSLTFSQALVTTHYFPLTPSLRNKVPENLGPSWRKEQAFLQSPNSFFISIKRHTSSVLRAGVK